MLKYLQSAGLHLDECPNCDAAFFYKKEDTFCNGCFVKCPQCGKSFVVGLDFPFPHDKEIVDIFLKTIAAAAEGNKQAPIQCDKLFCEDCPVYKLNQIFPYCKCNYYVEGWRYILSKVAEKWREEGESHE